MAFRSIIGPQEGDIYKLNTTVPLVDQEAVELNPDARINPECAPEEVRALGLGIVATIDAGAPFYVLDSSETVRFPADNILVGPGYKPLKDLHKSLDRGVPVIVGADFLKRRMQYPPNMAPEHFEIQRYGDRLFVANRITGLQTLVTGQFESNVQSSMDDFALPPYLTGRRTIRVVPPVVAPVVAPTPAPSSVWPRVLPPVAPLPTPAALTTPPSFFSNEHYLGPYTIDSGYAYDESKGFGNDGFIAGRNRDLYAVLDGIGDKRDSAYIVDLAIDSIVNTADSLESYRGSIGLTPEDWVDELQASLEALNRKIVERKKRGELEGGTTVTAGKVLLYNGDAYLAWVHIGDSRLYMHNRAGGLVQLTRDESTGRYVHNSIGGSTSEVVQTGVTLLENHTDLIFVTDGITGDDGSDVLTDAEIINALNNPTAKGKADALLATSRKDDDKTCVVVTIN